MFETLVFSDGRYQKLDRFLDLLEGPSTTFAPFIKSIHIFALFHRIYRYKSRNNAHLLASKLPQLKSLRLASFEWHFIPQDILEFFYAFRDIEVSFESVWFYKTSLVIDLFQSTLISKGVTLFNFRFEDDSQDSTLSNHTHLFQRDFHLNTIDSTTLVKFQKVWDPAINNNTKLHVDSFHLRLYDPESTVDQSDLPVLQRFLLQIGAGLKSLAVDLCDASFERELLMSYTKVDFSSCTALKAVHMGIIDIGSSDVDERRVAHMDAVWAILKSIPSSTVETVGLILDAKSYAHQLPMSLRSFQWVPTIQHIQAIFPSLKLVKIKIGGYDLKKENLQSVADALAQEIQQHVSIPVLLKASSWTPIHKSF
ncbi:hypothetical protein H0H87_010416, partial [Tephrocybe sp. NHM501043]